jgi:hypothetical protein
MDGKSMWAVQVTPRRVEEIYINIQEYQVLSSGVITINQTQNF